MRATVLFLLSVVVLAGSLQGADAKKDPLQGTWRAESVEDNGKKPKANDHVLIFKGDTFTVQVGDTVDMQGTYKADPSKKPKALDLTFTEGAKEIKGKISLGIYSVKGDTLQWCGAKPGETERPKDFAAPAGSHRMYATFKRIKD
jgi:uncharacterized protein (TIGR03067 family)